MDRVGHVWLVPDAATAAAIVDVVVYGSCRRRCDRRGVDPAALPAPIALPVLVRQSRAGVDDVVAGKGIGVRHLEDALAGIAAVLVPGPRKERAVDGSPQPSRQVLPCIEEGSRDTGPGLLQRHLDKLSLVGVGRPHTGEVGGLNRGL